MPAISVPVSNVIFGRSSSHFTRLTRIFAAELRVDYSFQIVLDIMSSDVGDYGGNPALKLPTLQTPQDVWFGALNICRALWRQSSAKATIVWPEDLNAPLLANAQELVVHAMSTEVNLIMSKVGGGAEGSAHQAKMKASLVNSMSWLEDNAAKVFDALPASRDLSYLEVALFCLVTHLEFREVLSTEPFSRLRKFCEQFATRTSAVNTVYRFDK